MAENQLYEDDYDENDFSKGFGKGATREADWSEEEDIVEQEEGKGEELHVTHKTGFKATKDTLYVELDEDERLEKI